MANIFKTVKEDQSITVRGLINKHHTLFLKRGLIQAGHASNFPALHGLRDEILVFDEEGNIFPILVRNGVWFERIILRQPHDPTQGQIVASLSETRRTSYNPIPTIRRTLGITSQTLENNRLYFYRAEHPDTAPFLNIHPLWIAVPTFMDLLAQFPSGNFSQLHSIPAVKEPACDLTIQRPIMSKPYLMPVPSLDTDGNKTA